MKNIIKYLSFIIILVGISSFTLKRDTTEKKYKVLIQMRNYVGEGAYVVISVLDNKNNYIKTLQVFGDDEEWYQDIAEWWNFQQDKDTSTIDAISGETIAGGERSTFSINIEEDWLDKNYKLRFETAVEEVEYHAADVEIPLTTSALKTKQEGTGFIRYIRMLPL